MELKRRDFLKITGLLGAGFFGKVNINEADPYNVWKPIIPDQLDKAETVCPLCDSFCSLEVLKKRELIFGLYKKDDTKGICPKVAAYHNIIYGEDRIKTPLLRVKERGTFAYKPIDYDRALQILKEKLSKTDFFTDANAKGESERFYLASISTKINFIPDNRLKALVGAEKVFFDLENASLILNFGTDLLTDGNFIERANFLSENAKKVITFSPVITKGTALGEKWYPVKLSELVDIVRKLKDAIAGKPVDKAFLSEVAEKVKRSKNVCLTFSPALLEFEEGLAAVKEIISLANQLKVVNREGGIYFYNSVTNSKSFNFFTETSGAYLAYNIDPLLLYPVKETEERLKTLPFIVYAGHHHSEISKFADLILPLPYFVEKREFYIKKSARGHKLIKSDFAVEGGVESQELRKKENIEVIFQKLLNFKAPYGIKGIDEVARLLRPSLPALSVFLTSLEKKVNISNVNPAITLKEDLPKNSKEVELILSQNNVLDFNTQGSKWAEELDSRNPLLINSNTAAKLKLKNKDNVVISTNNGKVRAKVFIFEGIADNTISLNRFRNKSTIGSPYKTGQKTKDRETKLIWWKPEEIEIEKIFSYSQKSTNFVLISCDKIDIVKG
ncbi:MAG: hypothetical protein OHK0040_07200 [bacterium]